MQRERTRGKSRVVHNWDECLPFTFTIENDSLSAAPDLTGVVHRAADLERERRLYLRLADLVAEDTDGRPRLRSDWKKRALDFANIYTDPLLPMLPSTIETAPRRQGSPISYVGEEALLLWWVVRLMHQLEKPRPSLREALVAVLHIFHLDATLLGEATDLLWRLFGNPFPVPVSQESATYPSQVKRPFRLRPLPMRRCAAYVGKLREALDANDRDLWTFAAKVLAEAILGRLVGVNLHCQIDVGGGRSLPSMGFSFGSPLARVWYGIWEDLSGMQLRRCVRCGRFFPASRKDQRCCSSRCANAERVNRWRESHDR